MGNGKNGNISTKRSKTIWAMEIANIILAKFRSDIPWYDRRY
jgi:hypothetical protein